MASDFEIFQKIVTMRMISLFLAALRLSGHRTPELRIVSGGGDPYPEIEDAHSSRIEDCEPMRMASLHFLKISSNSIREGSSLAGGRPSPARNKVSDLINIYVALRFSEAFSI